MVTKVRIVVNREGVGQILRSPGVLRDMKRRAEAIAAKAGPGNEVNAEIGRHRARASVRTETREARRAEATSRKLSKSIDAGRS